MKTISDEIEQAVASVSGGVDPAFYNISKILGNIDRKGQIIPPCHVKPVKVTPPRVRFTGAQARAVSQRMRRSPSTYRFTKSPFQVGSEKLEMFRPNK